MRLILAAALFLAPAAAPVAALAQSLPCAPRERMLSLVIDQRGEARLATGETARGASVELYAGDSGSWTLLLTLPDGRTCLLANGRGFTATGGLQPARGQPA